VLRSVIKLNGVPNPGSVLIVEKLVRSTAGTFYLEFNENGRRVQRPVGNSTREAKDSWYRHCNLDEGIEPTSMEDDGDQSESTPITTSSHHQSCSPERYTEVTGYRGNLHNLSRHSRCQGPLALSAIENRHHRLSYAVTPRHCRIAFLPRAVHCYRRDRSGHQYRTRHDFMANAPT
jgi:hypothetical protein